MQVGQDEKKQSRNAQISRDNKQLQKLIRQVFVWYVMPPLDSLPLDNRQKVLSQDICQFNISVYGNITDPLPSQYSDFIHFVTQSNLSS